MTDCTSQGDTHLLWDPQATYLQLVEGVRVGQDAQGADGVSGLLWRDGQGAPEGLQQSQGLPQPPSCLGILTILALIAVNPALISAMLMETLQLPKWKILSPAVGVKFAQQDTEKRQRNKGDPLMAAGRPAQGGEYSSNSPK